MSSGTNPERLSQNNELLTANNEELVNLKTIIEALPETLDTTDATATLNDIVEGKTAYVNGEKITGTIKRVSAGYLNVSAAEISEWENSNKVVANSTAMTSPQYLTTTDKVSMHIGKDKLAAAIGLTADKIAAGNTILGVEGTSAGLDTSDATATASDILADKTAYVNGGKITGTLADRRDVSLVSDSAESIYDSGTYLDIAGSLTNISGDSVIKENAGVSIICPYSQITDAIGLIPGMLVEGNTILGIEGTATELDVTKTEIWDTTNNDVQVGASGVEIIPDRAVITLTTPIQGGITSKEQLLLSGTGNIMIETSINDSGCLCAKLIGIESLESYMAVSGEIVVIVDTEGAYLGTYQYSAGTWSEIISASAYNNTLTETEYDEAVETTHTILGEEEI